MAEDNASVNGPAAVAFGWTTVETQEAALKLAEDLVAARMAACVQIEGPITSVYRWKEAVESGEEWRLLVKFPAARAAAVAAWLRRHHPYETPEWVVGTASHGLPDYAAWVVAEADGNAPEV